MHKRFTIYLILAALVAGFAWWWMGEGAETPALETAVAGPVPAASAEPAAAAASPPAELERTALPAPEAAAAQAAPDQVRIRFRDWFSGDDLVPRAVVELTAEGAARVAQPDANGEFQFASGAPIVLVANFERHVPLLAVVRDAPLGEVTPIHAYEAAFVNLDFDAIEASRFPADARMKLQLEPSQYQLPRSEHGQWQSVQHRFMPWARGAGEPDLQRAPAEWFDARRAEAWRAGALRDVQDRRGQVPSPVSAISLGATSTEVTLTGPPIRFGPFPARYELIWRTALSVAVVDAGATSPGISGVDSEGERYGKFVVPPGEHRLRFAWSEGASILGRIQAEGLPGGEVPPIVTVSSVVHDGHSPPIGSVANLRVLDVDMRSGEFVATGLAPGEYQINAAWSVGRDVKVSALRAEVAAGEHRDLGYCPVLPGPPLLLELECRDLRGEPLDPGLLFTNPSRMRATFGVNDHSDDRLTPSNFMSLPVAFGSYLHVHGLHPGMVWAHTGLPTEIQASDLRAGVRLLRFEPQGDRVTMPQESRVTAVARFQVDVVPVTLRFEFPDDARGMKFRMGIADISNGTQVTVAQVTAEIREQQRKDEVMVELAPGEYSLFAYVSGWSNRPRPEPGSVSYWAHGKFSVREPNQIVDVSVVPGLSMRVPKAPGLEPIGEYLSFELESLNGVRDHSRSFVTARAGADGVLILDGVPPGAVLRHRSSKSAWKPGPDGALVRADQ